MCIQERAIEPHTLRAISCRTSAAATPGSNQAWRLVQLESSQKPRNLPSRLNPFVERLAPAANPAPVCDPRLLLAAGRRDRQVLGPKHLWAAWARRLLQPWRRSQWCLPTEPHHRVSRADSACPYTCSCSPRAEMGTKLPSVDLGAGRTAVAVSAGDIHTCALLVRLPSG